MKQSGLYDMAGRCGCTVMVFSDHPDFFLPGH